MNKSPEQALCHLFFTCCGKDGSFDTKEIEWVSAKFVDLGINKGIDFKNEFIRYNTERQTAPAIEAEYIKGLVTIIQPANTLALYSWCVEICVSDDLISLDEQSLLDNIATALDITSSQKDVITALMVERTVVKLNKIV